MDTREEVSMKLKRAAWFFRSLFFLMVSGTVLGAAAMGLVFWYFSRSLPEIITVNDYRPPIVTRILGAGGKEDEVLAEFYKERRYVVPYEKIPEVVVQAFISAEDDTFFQHQGINPASMLRASIANFRAGQVVQGGSTITQQMAKSLLLTPERSFSRKFKEILLANKIERNLTKQQILHLYLNQIYLGRGSYGVQAASLNYFNKDIGEITLAEAAILAGLPQAPGKYSPNQNPKKAKDRQLYVLRRMYENRFISQSQMVEAAAKPVKIFYESDINQKYAPYLVEHIRRYLLERYGEKALYQDGLSVSVPATRELSLAATASTQSGLREVDKRQGYRGPTAQLKTDEEKEKFLLESREKLIEHALGYQIFLPDGRLDPIASIKEAGFKEDSELVKEGELYKALVTSVDDAKKSAGAMVGGVRFELPLKEMRWARLSKDGRIITGEPGVPSKVVSKGDLILIRAIRGKDGGWQAALEQEPTIQGALISIDAQNGAVLGMVGGYDHTKSEFNRAVQATRQVGSSFKPIIYAAGIENGFTPASVIIDAPLTFEDRELGKWKPANFDEKFHGDTTFRQALIKSRNVPTIRIVQEVQIARLVEYAKRLGMTAEFPMDLSISLGSMTVSPLELAKVYGLFPRLGRKLNPVFYTDIKDRDGKLLEEIQLKNTPPTIVAPPLADDGAASEPKSTTVSVGITGKAFVRLPTYPLESDPEQVLDPRVAYVMTHLMTEVVNYGTGTDARELGRAVAGKTGTTNDYLDAWFTGFTPNIVTVAWVGHDNQTPLGSGETGARAALPIWLSFMKEAVKSYPESEFPVPSGIIFAPIDPNTGKRLESNSSRAIREAFIEGTEPKIQSNGPAGPAESTGDFLKEDFQ
jgi:penicillin-binding protein 1A